MNFCACGKWIGPGVIRCRNCHLDAMGASPYSYTKWEITLFAFAIVVLIGLVAVFGLGVRDLIQGAAALNEAHERRNGLYSIYPGTMTWHVCTPENKCVRQKI